MYSSSSHKLMHAPELILRMEALLGRTDVEALLDDPNRQQAVLIRIFTNVQLVGW